MELIADLLEKASQVFSLDPQPSVAKSANNQTVGIADKEEVRSDINSIASSYKIENMIVVQPNSFEESQEIVDKLKEKHLIAVNLSSINHQVATKIIDFISGAVYALDGNSEKIGENIFLFTPKSVKITYKSTINNSLSSSEESLSLEEKERLHGE